MPTRLLGTRAVPVAGAAFQCTLLQLPHTTSELQRSLLQIQLDCDPGNVMFSTVNWEEKEEKLSLSLRFKQQTGQERASVIAPPAIFVGTTCKSLCVPSLEGNCHCTTVNMGGLRAPFSVFIVTGWRGAFTDHFKGKAEISCSGGSDMLQILMF